MNRAKQLRLDNGCGIVDTAELAGISTRTLRKIEAGDEVTAAALGRLAAFYKIPASELLTPAVFSSTEGEAA